MLEGPSTSSTSVFDLESGSLEAIMKAASSYAFSPTTPNSDSDLAMPSLAVPITPLAEEKYEHGRTKEQRDSISDFLGSVLPQIGIKTDVENPVLQYQPLPIIQNIVATCNLDCKVDLKEVALRARNAEYNPKRFSAVVMRIREPRTTALLFGSGKMVVTGARSEESARLAARKHARIVQKVGFSDVKFKEFKLQNLVCSVDVKFAIQLEGLCITHAQFSTYEPELFPGLIYRMVVPRVVLLIFVSGKIVITGAKSKKDVDDAFHQIYPILKGFKK